MPFGKHRGEPIDTIPEAYRCWLLDTCENLKPTLRRAIEQTLGLDDRQAEPKLLPSIVVDGWYRQLAREFHPDARGSHLGMLAVNRAHELLVETIGTT